MFRFENLKSELDIVSPTGGMPSIPGHQRTPSGISNISLDSVSSTATLEARPFEDEEVSRSLVITNCCNKLCPTRMVIVALCGYFLNVSFEIKVLHPNEKRKLGEYMAV